MPLYQYRCKECDHLLEELVRSSDAVPAAGCPVCGSTGLVRQFSAFALGREAKATTAAPCDIGPACPSAGSCASGACPA